MKVLISTDLYDYQINGVTISIITLRDELKKKGHDVRVLALSPNRKSMKKNNDYYLSSFRFPIYPGVRFSIAYRDKMLDEIVKWSPDIVHVQTEFSSYLLAKRIIRRIHTPVVHTCHTVYEEYVKYICPSKKLGKKIVKSITSRVLSRADGAIVPTKKLEGIVRNYGVKIPLYVVPTGINLDKFREKISKEEKDSIKKNLNIPKESKVLLTVCRIGAEKNLDEIVNILPDLIKRNPNIVFVIVGDGPYRKKLESKVNELGINKHIFFTGMINPKEIGKYYQLGDIFVSASQSESQGLTYVEAIANGLPLVCKEDECLTSVIENGKNGYKYKTSEEFIEYIIKIINDENLHKAMSNKSSEISKQYNKEVFVEKVENLYKSIIKSKVS